MAVIIYGPQGSGKSTQAELVSRQFGLVHFDTGAVLRDVLYDPKNQENPEIQKHRAVNEAGGLNDPEFVLTIVSERIQTMMESGFGVVFSGSPRTMYEAFGTDTVDGLFTLLELGCGKEHVHIFFIALDTSKATQRNEKRFGCPVCKRQYLPTHSSDGEERLCPICSHPLEVRADDTPSSMVKRLEEYRTRTTPIFDDLKKRGYQLHEINGDQKPYEVFSDIKHFLH